MIERLTDGMEILVHNLNLSRRLRIVYKAGNADWVRGPKKVNVSDIPLEKIQKAHGKRGINVEPDPYNPSKLIVTKTVVEGMPAPEPPKKP